MKLKKINDIHKTLFLIIILFFTFLFIFSINNNKNINDNHLNQNNIQKNLIDSEEKQNDGSINNFEYGLWSFDFTSFYFFENGAIYGWGNNQYGQLGIGNTEDQGSPIVINETWSFNATDIRSLYSDGQSVFVILNNSHIYGWGYNTSGQLGNSTISNQTSPTRLDDDWGIIGSDITNFYFKFVTVFVFLNDNSIWAWGRNTQGQLGIGSTTDSTSPIQVDDDWTFTSDLIQNFYVTSKSIYTFLNDGSVYVWGLNQYGQLGIGSTTNQTSPLNVNTLWGFNTSLIDGIYYFESLPYQPHNRANVFVSLSNGEWWGWGDNEFSPLGTGADWDLSGTVASPVELTSYWSKIFDTNEIKELYTDTYNTFVILNNNQIWGWGRNFSGTLGINHTYRVIDPTYLSVHWGFDGSDIQNWILNQGTSYVFLNDGTVHAWGENRNGELGYGGNSNNTTPTVAVDPSNNASSWPISSGEEVKEFITPENYVFLITTDNTLYAWGNNYGGALGVQQIGGFKKSAHLLIQFSEFNYVWNDDDLSFSFIYNMGWWEFDELYYTFVDNNGNDIVSSTLISDLNTDGSEINSITLNDIINLSEQNYYIYISPIDITGNPGIYGFVISNLISVYDFVNNLDVDENSITRTSAKFTYDYSEGYTNLDSNSLSQYSLDGGNNWAVISSPVVVGTNTFEITNLNFNVYQYSIRVAPLSSKDNYSETSFTKPTANDTIISNVTSSNITGTSAEISYYYNPGNNSTGNIQYSLNGGVFQTIATTTSNGTNSFVINDLQIETNYTIIIIPEGEGNEFSDQTSFTTTDEIIETPDEENEDSSSWWENNSQWIYLTLIIIGGVLVLILLIYIIYRIISKRRDNRYSKNWKR